MHTCVASLPACVSYVILLRFTRLVTSAKQWRYPCSRPPTDSMKSPEMRFEFPFILIGKLTIAFFFNKPVMVRNQILVHRWGPRARILALFRRRTWPELSFVCGTGQGFIATFKFFLKLLSTLIYHSVEHDNFGFSAGWFLDKVSETDYTFASPSFSLLMYRLN